MNMLILFIQTFKMSIDLLSVIMQDEGKKMFIFQERKGKIRWVLLFRMLAIDTSNLFTLKLFLNLQITLLEKDEHERDEGVNIFI